MLFVIWWFVLILVLGLVVVVIVVVIVTALSLSLYCIVFLFEGKNKWLKAIEREMRDDDDKNVLQCERHEINYVRAGVRSFNKK